VLSLFAEILENRLLVLILRAFGPRNAKNIISFLDLITLLFQLFYIILYVLNLKLLFVKIHLFIRSNNLFSLSIKLLDLFLLSF
jgi:hypothetical protein